MLNRLLADNDGGVQNIIMLVIVAVLIVVIVVFYVLSSKKRKKQEQDAQDLINAVKPGNKVKTIGGICGIVVEVDNEENTFVLETGTEASGKSYLKFDRQAIYQTDAVVEKKEEAKSEPAEENSDATAGEPVEESSLTDVPAETASEAEITESVQPDSKSKKKKNSSDEASAE